ncbi:hypothetical protein WH96_10015 [Kiloniella spongiae]|uniref:Plasmid stabilization protein n=1 Tax=Kiloniella spongiae TaxID=1489064 RepID=A0A0H2MVQ2_9PROT|nr:type II toxin-antitoxin system RelE/ParE family toxin [Kiloniella spongiae]KLN60800.1 hypothetical protein WH96_10015 [Kiloniella spongiae]
MTWRIEFSADAEQDFSLIFDHLFESYKNLGSEPKSAFDYAEKRLAEIMTTAESLCDAPYRGTLHNDLLPGLRHVTINQAIFWFNPDEVQKIVRIFAVFYGGQDHIRHMLVRLL